MKTKLESETVKALQVRKKLDIYREPYTCIVSVASNSAYIPPASVRAIPVARGWTPKVMFNRGMAALRFSRGVAGIAGDLTMNFRPGYSLG